MSGNLNSYFYTWSNQQTALTFDIDGADEFHYLSKEKKILDFSSTSFQASFGLKNDFITDAISAQAKSFPLSTPKAKFKLKEDISFKLKNLISQETKGKIFWTSSGAESIENAIKMSRHIKGRNTIVSRERSYHGASLGALSIGGDWRSKAVSTVDQWTLRIPEPEVDKDAKIARKVIEDYGPEKIAGICLEVITGGNGVIIPAIEWYQNIQKICDDYNLHLILDEVICGFGRTGEDFGFHHYKNILKPNFICLAKAITGGFFPFGAVWVENQTASYYDQNILPCGLTNYAHPIGLAATDKTMDFYLSIKESLLKKNIEIFHELLMDLSKNSKVKTMRKIGMMSFVELKDSFKWEDFIRNNIFLYFSNNNLILAPALNMPEKLLREGFEKISTVIGD